MHDVYRMKSLESLYNIYQHSPYLFLFKVHVLFLVVTNLLVEIPIISVLHHDTILSHKIPDSPILNKCLLISNNVVVLNGCQYSDLSQSILLLFAGEVVQSDNLQCVFSLIGNPLNLVDFGVSSLTCII